MRPDPDGAFRSGSASGAAIPAGGRRLLFAIEASPLPLVLVDPREPGEPIVLADVAFSRMPGYAPSEILGRNRRFFRGPGSDPGVVDSILQAIRSREEPSVEILNRCRDGKPFRTAFFLCPWSAGMGPSRTSWHRRSTSPPFPTSGRERFLGK